jgi:transposase
MAKKRFSDETKETIVRLYNHGKGKEIKDLAIEYGVPQSTVRYWAVGKKKRAEKSKLKNESHSELDQLKKEMKMLKEENDILKKAITIFAKN